MKSTTNNILDTSYYIENKDTLSIEIGIDEAGRGCLFGPVCVAAVSLKNFDDKLVNDIKDYKKL